MRRDSRIGDLIQRRVTQELEKLSIEGVPRDALIPDYRPGCKRILISNNYYSTLAGPSVSVEVEPIARVHPDSIECRSGARHEVDTIVFGTGFRSTEFLTPLHVTGRNGRTLSEEWAQGAEAHLGISVHGFPNFFILYGPNTNLGHNSIIFMMEAQTRRIVSLLRRMRRRDAATVDVVADAMSDYNAALQRDADGTVWTTDCDSWYKDDAGRLTNNWPDFSVRYWAKMKRISVSDYEFAGSSVA